ncbi:Peptidoglycan-binding lysin domain protein [Coraliomargarita akajimensis DSM 45221]|uniref:Peptidoglycan-binding lysin domain protein n=2 Tax=Coraliomargarita TaxID=442430 RepID=D5ENK6_CORAD|nr:Peptidoglycan-binding lysin domain protein [Coraliomargarita akajimensis DSM 45221]
MKLFRPALYTSLLVALISFSPLAAQNDMRVTIANMNQDLAALSQQVKSLRLEIEQMRRDNAKLRSQVAAAQSNSSTQSQLSSLARSLDSLRAEFRAADAAQQKAILSEVNKKLDGLTRQLNKSLEAIANAANTQPNISAPAVSFSDDYPKSGKPYTVRSGDTLSGIARAHGSTVKDIQNANKIVNPARDLQVGQTIFIPIAQ